MAINTIESTAELQEYCLMKLGKPVINIEVSPEQLCDRIDDALQMYSEKHYNGTEEVFFKHTISSGDVSRGYLRIKDEIVAILEVVETNNISTEIFDNIKYLLLQDSYNNSSQLQIADYYIAREHYSTVKYIINPVRSFTFNFPTHRLIPNAKLIEGNIVVLRGYRTIDDELCTDIYNERALKKLATAYIKQQWGANLLKFSDVQMTGGVTLNGQKIYDDATAEIEKLEEEFSDMFEKPIGMFIG